MLVLQRALLVVILLLAMDNVRMRMAQDNSANDAVQKRYEQRNLATRMVAQQQSPTGSIKGGEVRPVLIPTTIQLNPPRPKK